MAGKTSESLDNPSSTDHQSGSLRYPSASRTSSKSDWGHPHRVGAAEGKADRTPSHQWLEGGGGGREIPSCNV